jgi:hypothetical protein
MVWTQLSITDKTKIRFDAFMDKQKEIKGRSLLQDEGVNILLDQVLPKEEVKANVQS